MSSANTTTPPTGPNVIFPAWAAETYAEKALRKCRENPFVPLGMLATTYALVGSAWQLYQRDSRKLQLYWRWRVGLQGLTILAFVVGSYELGFGEKIHGPRDAPPAPRGAFALFPGLTEKVHQETQAAAREKGNREREAFLERVRIAEERENQENEILGKKRAPSSAQQRLMAKAQFESGTVTQEIKEPVAVASSGWYSWLPWSSKASSKPKDTKDSSS